MAEFFVRRPIVAMVIAIIMVIIGLVSLSRLAVAQYPDITPPEVSVETTYTFSLEATDDESQKATREFSITVTHGAKGGGQFC